MHDASYFNMIMHIFNVNASHVISGTSNHTSTSSTCTICTDVVPLLPGTTTTTNIVLTTSKRVSVVKNLISKRKRILFFPFCFSYGKIKKTPNSTELFFSLLPFCFVVCTCLTPLLQCTVEARSWQIVNVDTRGVKFHNARMLVFFLQTIVPENRFRFFKKNMIGYDWFYGLLRNLPFFFLIDFFTTLTLLI